MEPSLGFTLKTLLGSIWSRIQRFPSAANWRSLGSLIAGFLKTFSTRLVMTGRFALSTLVAAARREATARDPVDIKKPRRENAFPFCMEASLAVTNNRRPSYPQFAGNARVGCAPL